MDALRKKPAKPSAKKRISSLLKRVRIQDIRLVKRRVPKKRPASIDIHVPKKSKARKETPLDLKRFSGNPIIAPEGGRYWENKATFNPAAITHAGKVHIVYRAIGESDVSILGYAASNDGLTFAERSAHAIYCHKKEAFDKRGPRVDYSSGGGWSGGCEDPRLTMLGSNVYMTYTAFDGWGSIRMALTSISLDDFTAKRWNWKEPVYISAPGEIQKNWVIFPEKIKGKYAILHSLSPEIMIEYVESLDKLDGTTFIESIHQNSPLWQARNKWIRGAGPVPIKTEYGWLVLYHAMEEDDPNRYKLWAMILDSHNPKKILYRSLTPILEPDAAYENEGLKAGVVYSCGAIVKDNTLFVYYGGADTVSCVAMAPLDTFLKELISAGNPTLAKGTSK